MADGFPPGIALDDAAGAHYVGTELHEVVASTARRRRLSRRRGRRSSALEARVL